MSETQNLSIQINLEGLGLSEGQIHELRDSLHSVTLDRLRDLDLVGDDVLVVNDPRITGPDRPFVLGIIIRREHR